MTLYQCAGSLGRVWRAFLIVPIAKQNTTTKEVLFKPTGKFDAILILSLCLFLIYHGFRKELYFIKFFKKLSKARSYCDFVSSIKGEGIRPVYVPKETWESWKKYWADPKVIEKSKIASKNRRGGEDAAASGTHTGGSISIGDHHKRLEKYQEILQNQSQTQSEVDQCQAYYEAVGGVKKRRIYGLGSQAVLYYGSNLRPSSVSDATSSVPPSNAQPAATGTLDELVTRLIPALTDSIIPALTDRLLPIIVERVRGLNPLVSSQMDTPNDHSSSMAPIVSAPATANIDQVHASVSDDDRGSSVSH
ncbi:uncharacterized protein LOC132629053 [Lycium barbarum]|uniref:uncharacterized protein LOC132629053 n=1 Tax=Lycium barbarum TaxID=112863 RepID=UPI00293ED55C|nr:uncharacterized protein LOC132629053 [Lycium barbarum]